MADRHKKTATFPTFFMMWAAMQRWEVPALHLIVCQWLDTCDSPVRVLMVFRGAAKSTIYAVYKAYCLWKDPTQRNLIWAADGPLSTKLTRDTINVLRRHPLCKGMLPKKPGQKRFWVNGSNDQRNASMEAVGVDSNATGARADAIDFDDIEVPKNIKTPEARANLRNKVEESTHIMVPGGQKTYIGTPHTHDSIYKEQIEGGAAMLKIPLFRHVKRYEKTTGTVYSFDFKPDKEGLYVMAGIGRFAKMMEEGVDYTIKGKTIVFAKPPGVVIDICAGNTWPERFTHKAIEIKRKDTRTLNAWDSQYMLESKPISETRLDPDKLRLYDAEPTLRHANDTTSMWLGQARIVGASCKWDPSSGKLRSDDSTLTVVFQDEVGRRYWHRAVALVGEVATTDSGGKTITGGQVTQIVEVVRELNLPRVTIETNGAGTFAAAYLKAALKQAKIIDCGVTERHETENKNLRILEAIEGPLTSRQLWAHTSVMESPAIPQMREWNPATQNQPDDYLDSLAGAISETPERIGRHARILGGRTRNDWRPETGTHEVTFEA